MLRTNYNILSLTKARQYLQVACFSSSQNYFAPHQPNAPLDLDPAFRTLLREMTMSIPHKSTPNPLVEQNTNAHRQLEVFSDDPALDIVDEDIAMSLEDESFSRESRKSPAALFGSHNIGAVVLPKQLQSSVADLIEKSDKSMLHADAKRLFSEDGGEKESDWDSAYDVKYKSHKQAFRHSDRDAAAFASVALPAHYSAIFSVLDHVKHRLGPEWKVRRVINWGAGTGSGLWASACAFQKSNPGNQSSMEHLTLHQSQIESYVGIDKRDGLVAIAKRLLQNVARPDMFIGWQRSFQPNAIFKRSEAKDVLALSAFLLSSVPASLTRKAVVKEMWESGAHTMIVIDHNSRSGFECVADARRYLLDLGAKEVEGPTTADSDIRGSHVVAPCPHDGACPLYHPGMNKPICGFEQRIQRPEFVRKTKHSRVGHEDVGYSYVVVQRGTRPSSNVNSEYGRMGEIGKEELEKQNAKSMQKELQLFAVNEVEDSRAEFVNDLDVSIAEEPIAQSPGELETILKLESFKWPRLVFPPLKRSGHVILDCCTAQGKIMRLTIPKSQGKQPYYDARKSGWGDLFPHEPKNRPVQRHGSLSAHNDVGKSRDQIKEKPKTSSYEILDAAIRGRKKKERKERMRWRNLSNVSDVSDVPDVPDSLDDT